MNYLHHEFDAGPNELIEVVLDHPANVQLLDEANFERYQSRQTFRYHGGYATESPVELRPPSKGRWHLVIDLGGGTGSVGASARVVPAELAGTRS